jgi:hypothetical protein
MHFKHDGQPDQPRDRRDVATKSVPRFAPVPALFTTMKCWPKRSDRYGAISRAIVSVLPPGGKGTTMMTGRIG